jgi:formate dehydrogenase major subunit
VSKQTLEAGTRIAGLEATESVCPYCAVGCSQLVYTRGRRARVDRGQPGSPINQGTLCPKGSASRQLIQQPGRLTKVLYRAPHGTEWEELELEQAMDMIAERVIAAREAGWQDDDETRHAVDRTLGFCSLGGATIDNEENYLIKKASRRWARADREPGPHMTLEHGPRSGDLARARRRHQLQQDFQNADCIWIQGLDGRGAPVGFRWAMKARERGARSSTSTRTYARTSAMADLHVPIRAGTDIAFLGG